MEPDLTIVGAGLTGLTAAIEAAERGLRVTVAEAHATAGGRARSLPAPYRANTGPHGIYVDGPWWAWLERRGLTPPVVPMPRDTTLVRVGDQIGPWPAEVSRAIAALPADAPAGESFRDWLLRHVSAATAEAIIGVAFIFTFDYDPGRLSAAFARSQLERAMAGGVRYVTGGWSTLVGLLTDRAVRDGVQVRTRTRMPALPDGPVILATSLAAARELTGDRTLTWPSARVVTIDLGVQTDGEPASAGTAGNARAGDGWTSDRRTDGTPVPAAAGGDARAGQVQPNGNLAAAGVPADAQPSSRLADVTAAKAGPAGRGPGWFRVFDLDDRIYIARYTAADPSLAPAGHDLIQISAACAPGERKADAEGRIQRLLDQTWPGWRAAVRWHRSALRTHCTGALDLPGTTWHDRPAISRGNGLMVATDQSAAPGLLAEVGIAAAQLAVGHVADRLSVTAGR